MSSGAEGTDSFWWYVGTIGAGSLTWIECLEACAELGI